MVDDRQEIAEYAERLYQVYRSASPQERREGREWYEIAKAECLKIAKESGFTFKRVAFATAALSNNTNWEQNVNLAHHVAFAVKEGIQATGHFFGLIDKATRILRDGEFSALSGPKVIPFAQAIYRPHSSAAVIDRWMYRAALGTSETPSLTEARLRRVQIALRRVARRVRKPVSDVQAIIWIAIRNQASKPVPF